MTQQLAEFFAVNHALLGHGEGAAVAGLLGGSFLVFFGQKRFEPAGRNAQHGRWLGARRFGRVFLLVGVVGVILIAIAVV